jgi:hypothetical protein
MKTISIATFLIFLLYTPLGFAAQYRCTIQRIDFSDETGGGERAMFTKQLVGGRLIVDTHTGVMTGALRNSLFKAPLVLNHGDNQNSFVSATIVSPKFDKGVVGVDTRILTINTWRPTNRKPFSLFWDDMLMRGNCILIE